jgi:hypothetical protein
MSGLILIRLIEVLDPDPEKLYRYRTDQNRIRNTVQIC